MSKDKCLVCSSEDNLIEVVDPASGEILIVCKDGECIREILGEEYVLFYL